MALQSLHQFFYYHNKNLNNMKCWEIGMDPYIHTNQCSSFIKLEHCLVFVQHMEVSQNSQICLPIGRGGVYSRWGFCFKTSSCPLLYHYTFMHMLILLPPFFLLPPSPRSVWCLREHILCFWLIGIASDACYYLGSLVCSYREYSGVLF